MTAARVAELERVAGALARGAGAERALTAPATSAALWVWVATGDDPDTTELEGLLAELGDVRVALGSAGAGIEGFRASHADAFAAQRLMARLGSNPHLVRYADVKVVALLTQDESRALAFVAETLGELEGGPAVLRETLRTYLRAQSNATRAAEQLYAHRNTIVARLAKAEELLPRPLAESALDVAVALEVMHWRGASAGEGRSAARPLSDRAYPGTRCRRRRRGGRCSGRRSGRRPRRRAAAPRVRR